MTFVPVNDISPINQYTATGGQTDFVFSFVIYETANIGVYVNGVLKTETTDYIVKKSDGSSVLAADLADGLSGGIVVFNSGLALDDEVSLNRDIPVERVSGFTTSGAFDSAVINKELNVITAVQQELELGIERALILPDSDTAALPFELPSKTSRSSKYLAFDAEGQPIAAAGTAGAADVTITSFAETLLDDGNATTMLSTLGFSAYAKTLIDDADAATARGTLEAQEDVITTRGDVIRGGSSDVAERLALGTSGYSLQSDGIDVVWQEIPLPKGYINGLTIANNGSDPEHDIDIAVGDCRDFANTKNIKLTSAITKQIDANWAEGAAAGGFPSSLTLSNTTWYRVFVILKSDGTIDAGYDTSATAANLLSDATGYAEYRQVGYSRN